MKIKIVLATLSGVLALGFAYQATAKPANENETTIAKMVSVLQEPVEAVAPPAAAEPQPPIQAPAAPEAEVQAPAPASEPVQEVQAPEPPQPALAPESVVIQDSVVADYPPLMSVPVPVADPCCSTCCVTPCCCCPPPPTPTVFCLVDPCGCTHEVCINVPACCGNEEPYINWRKGILGRQFATLCWTCCNHDVEVLITRRGRIRVRD